MGQADFLGWSWTISRRRDLPRIIERNRVASMTNDGAFAALPEHAGM
ncbi:hypothetical protein X729_31865 [Mesorhizobium sp. L103C131B0]|nr:hypothetical protein X729_31865 [Mesorhizobium sp. L103C131B0]